MVAKAELRLPFQTDLQKVALPKDQAVPLKLAVQAAVVPVAAELVESSAGQVLHPKVATAAVVVAELAPTAEAVMPEQAEDFVVSAELVWVVELQELAELAAQALVVVELRRAVA